MKLNEINRRTLVSICAISTPGYARRFLFRKQDRRANFLSNPLATWLMLQHQPERTTDEQK
ncbi:MAG: hypothetical protein AAF629_34525 [Chloroflexota bacterium]